jgi:sigma-B regulation protein RsbU (phosphoserine phosphatase)
VNLAVEAMRRGVRDFVQKPWDNEHLVAMLRAEIEKGRARRSEQEHERRELDEARRIQSKLLPSALPQVNGCEIAWSWQPASGIGGDCYDAISFDPSHLALSIADVVGKGIPAALLMSSLQASVRAFATAGTQPASLCHQVNAVLCGNMGEGRFISFFYCTLDSDLGVLTFANAGHYQPILVRRDGSVERLTAGGPVLGVLEDSTYEQAHVPFGAGDRLVLFTDGITEARRAAADDDEFGEERLIALAVEHRTCGAQALQERLAAAAAEFTGGAFHDDATLIVLAGNSVGRRAIFA